MVLTLAFVGVVAFSQSTYAYVEGQTVNVQTNVIAPVAEGLVDDIIGVVTEWLVALWALIITSISSAVALLYDPAGLTLATRITFIGYLALFGLGFSLVKLGQAFVMKFFKKG